MLLQVGVWSLKLWSQRCGAGLVQLALSVFAAWKWFKLAWWDVRGLHSELHFSCGQWSHDLRGHPPSTRSGPAHAAWPTHAVGHGKEEQRHSCAAVFVNDTPRMIMSCGTRQSLVPLVHTCESWRMSNCAGSLAGGSIVASPSGEALVGRMASSTGDTFGVGELLEALKLGPGT